MERASLFRDGAAQRIRRGVCRLLADMGYAPVWEFSLGNSRRADVMALNARGDIIIAEIKSGRADFLGDRKWRDYRPYCDQFYFAVEAAFPTEILPADAGLIVADGHGGSIVRQAIATPVNPARRRKLVLDLALISARRLQRIEDPPQ